MKLDLNKITLVAVGSTKIEETIKAIKLCCSYANFYDILFFSDIKNPYHKLIPKMNSIKDYDKFIIHELPKYIESDYCLTIHWDGFIVNPKAWDNIYYEYDYIGAPWPWMNYICGNGGFCLKSKKLLNTQKSLIPDDLIFNRPDDVLLCVDYRNQLEYHGCKFAPRSISQKFSTEYGGYDHFNSFGFHDFRPNPQFKYLVE
jgi:hypothetical protein